MGPGPPLLVSGTGPMEETPPKDAGSRSFREREAGRHYTTRVNPSGPKTCRFQPAENFKNSRECRTHTHAHTSLAASTRHSRVLRRLDLKGHFRIRHGSGANAF